jgi:hypothetical protein
LGAVAQPEKTVVVEDIGFSIARGPLGLLTGKKVSPRWAQYWQENGGVPDQMATVWIEPGHCDSEQVGFGGLCDEVATPVAPLATLMCAARRGHLLSRIKVALPIATMKLEPCAGEGIIFARTKPRGGGVRLAGDNIQVFEQKSERRCSAKFRQSGDGNLRKIRLAYRWSRSCLLASNRDRNDPMHPVTSKNRLNAEGCCCCPSLQSGA